MAVSFTADEITKFVNTLAKEINVNGKISSKYTINDNFIHTKTLKQALVTTINKGTNVTGIYNQHGLLHGMSAFERSHMQSQYAKLELEIITNLTTKLKMNEGIHKLYESLKNEHEVLYGRYEMLRVQYVRIRTKKNVIDPLCVHCGTGTPV